MFIIQEIINGIAEEPIISFNKNEAYDIYKQIAEENKIDLSNYHKYNSDIENLVNEVSEQNENDDWDLLFWEIDSILEQRYEKSLDILHSYLYNSFVENEFDRENFNFLKEVGKISEDSIFYNNIMR